MLRSGVADEIQQPVKGYLPVKGHWYMNSVCIFLLTMARKMIELRTTEITQIKTQLSMCYLPIHTALLFKFEHFIAACE